MNFIRSIIDFIFPATCFSCGEKLSKYENVVCAKCENLLQFLEDVCHKCGSPKKSKDCEVCKSNSFYFDKARSLYIFDEKLQKLIHEFKYNEVVSIGKYFGGKTGEFLKHFLPFENIDIIAPIPLHTVKKRSRGFNQSEILTKEISKIMNWKHIPKLILRKQFTQTQTKLNRAERQKNVADAFKINKKFEIKGKNILIVDDVFTTGSTANSICRLLKKNKAGKIYVLTIAKARQIF